MKKTIQILCVLASLAVVITSCKKDENVNVVVANGSATIIGLVTADLDEANDTAWDGTPEPGLHPEIAPEGTRIIAIISSEDLVAFGTGIAGDYSDQLYEATVGTDGTYELTVPANSEPVTVNIAVEDFIATQTTSTDTIIRNVFIDPGTPAVTVRNGSEVVVDVHMNEQYDI